jgi:delta-aminolevulinic acid dehydratase/porphobilinogen synthase
LSLAKQLKVADERRERFAQQANNLLRNSQITLRELAYPTTNASRNVVRRISRLENMMNYSQQQIVSVAQKILHGGFPNSIVNMHHNNIIRNVTESIRKHERRNRANQTVGRP